MIQEWNPYALHSEQGQRLSSTVELVYTMLLFVKRYKIVVSILQILIAIHPHSTQFHIDLSSGGMVLIYYTTKRKKTRKKKEQKED